MTPKSHFFGLEGRILQVLFWGMSLVFIAVMVWAWVASEKAKPVLLDLVTGQPVAERR